MGRGPLSRRRPRRRGPLHRAHQPAARRVPSRHSRRRRHLGRSPGFCRPEHKVTLIAVCTRPMSRADRSRFGGGVRSMRDDFSRRVFLKTSSMAGAAVTFAEEARGAARAAIAPAPAPSWVDRPMRWAQLTLVEDDPGKFDPRFWLDYFRRTHSDAVCLSAGGRVAYYSTEVPLHHRSRWLGNRDVLGELVEGCRDLGMLVLARTDPHATYDDVQQTHPDWIAFDAAGRPRRHWASPELWVTCALGPYNFDFMTLGHRPCLLGVAGRGSRPVAPQRRSVGDQ